jgi:hypothetical protein
MPRGGRAYDSPASVWRAFAFFHSADFMMIASRSLASAGGSGCHKPVPMNTSPGARWR